MKKISPRSVLLLLILLIQVACHKGAGDTYGLPKIPREFKFQLYTDSDFSNDNHLITFEAFIQRSSNQVLWDSTLPPMKIKDIPDSMHKIIFQKIISQNETGLLKTGFRYSIENVGISWYFDSSNAGQPVKIIDFNFH